MSNHRTAPVGSGSGSFIWAVALLLVAISVFMAALTAVTTNHLPPITDHTQCQTTITALKAELDTALTNTSTCAAQLAECAAHNNMYRDMLHDMGGPLPNTVLRGKK